MTKAQYQKNVKITEEEECLTKALQERGVDVVEIYRTGLRMCAQLAGLLATKAEAKPSRPKEGLGKGKK